jgi:hypothetical protein
MKESQLGCVPVRLNVAVGTPVVWTVKVPSVPAVKVVLAELVMAGACVTGAVSWTVRVKSYALGGCRSRRDGEEYSPNRRYALTSPSHSTAG